MKYIKYFSNVSSANEAGQNGMFSPHVDTISGLSTVNMVCVSTPIFTCSYNGGGVVTDVVPVVPVDPEGGKKLFYTTTDGQITSPNPSTSTISNWFGSAVLVSNTYSSVGVMQFDRNLTTMVDGADNKGAFDTNSCLRTISNSNISYLGNYTFRCCQNLQYADFPALTSVGGGPFSSCTSLQAASFPNCTYISGHGFYMCSSLQSVSFPVCTTIGNYAFYSCASLQSVSFPVCTTIGTWAFGGCQSLEKIDFPAVTAISNSAFNSCYFVSSNFNIGSMSSTGSTYGATLCDEDVDGVLYKSDQTIIVKGRPYISFASNSITTTISSSAFTLCTLLQNISFPNVTTIGPCAFGRSMGGWIMPACKLLQSAVFPFCVSIGAKAFNGCSSLQTITLGVSTICTLGAMALNSTPIASGTGSIYVPASLVSAYQSATNWAAYSSRIFAIPEV